MKLKFKKNKDSKQLLILYGLFYNIMRREHLVFKKILKDFLNK